MKKLLLFAVALVVAVSAIAADRVEVTGTNVRLRLQPSLQGEILKNEKTQKPIYPKKGAILECYGESGDFYIVNYEGTTAYITKQYTRPVGSKTAKPSKLNNTAPQIAKNTSTTAVKKAAPASVIVTGTNVRLRSGASLKSPALQDANGNNLHPNKGQKLRCVGEQGDFYKVNFAGLTCYISKQFSVPAE